MHRKTPAEKPSPSYGVTGQIVHQIRTLRRFLAKVFTTFGVAKVGIRAVWGG